MFADDTNLFKSSTNINTLFTEMNLDAQNLFEWFNSNKLSLNVGKTFFVLFTKLKNPNLNMLSLKIDDILINKNEVINFLEECMWTANIPGMYT